MLSCHQRVPTLINMTFWMMLNLDSWRKDPARPSSFWQLMTWQRNWTNEAKQHHHVTFTRAFQHGTPPIPPPEASASQHLGLQPSLLSSEQDFTSHSSPPPPPPPLQEWLSFSTGLTLFFVYIDDLGPTSKPIYDCSQITPSSVIKPTSQTPPSTSIGPEQALEELQCWQVPHIYHFKEKQPTIVNYSLYVIALKRVSSAKYLSVGLKKDLNCCPHPSNICEGKQDQCLHVQRRQRQGSNELLQWPYLTHNRVCCRSHSPHH